MHGIGNDFVMVDTLLNPLAASDLQDLARRINDRRFGIGGDGLILIEEGKTTPFRMRMFNPDGSESEMCGNGIRCFAKLLKTHHHIEEDSVEVETGAGVLKLELKDHGMVRVDMGLARFTRGEIGMIGTEGEMFVDQPVDRFTGTAVSMGNPHLVIFVPEVLSIDLAYEGAKLEHSPLFPNRVNVHFAQVESPKRIIQRTWERGAGATLACGTGACAVAAAALKTGRADARAHLQLPGGELEIEISKDWRVHMTGPAQSVFEGVFPA